MPTYQTATGYTVTYRLLPPDYLPALRARIQRELADAAPAIPTVAVPTGPGTVEHVPVNVAGELPDDPDLRARVLAYREAKAAHDAEVVRRLTEEVQHILTRTVHVPVDADQVREIRELYALAGKPLDEYSDAYVMLWYVALTDAADQAAITQSLQGISVGEAADAARAMFRRQLERQAS